jgi:F0F1-type ATP synthase assembly protein I
MEKQKNSNIPWWQPGLVLFTRLSAWIAVPVILALLLGRYLDRIFHAQPWMTMTCVSIAFITSIVMIVRIGLKEMNKK